MYIMIRIQVHTKFPVLSFLFDTNTCEIELIAAKSKVFLQETEEIAQGISFYCRFSAIFSSLLFYRNK